MKFLPEFGDTFYTPLIQKYDDWELDILFSIQNPERWCDNKDAAFSSDDIRFFLDFYECDIVCYGLEKWDQDKIGRVGTELIGSIRNKAENALKFLTGSAILFSHVDVAQVFYQTIGLQVSRAILIKRNNPEFVLKMQRKVLLQATEEYFSEKISMKNTDTF